MGGEIHSIETKVQTDAQISQPITEVKLSLEQVIDEKIKAKIPDETQRDNIIQACKDIEDELKQPLDNFIKNMNTFTILALSKIKNTQEIKSFLLSKFDGANPNKSVEIVKEINLESVETKEEKVESEQTKALINQTKLEIKTQVELGRDAINLAKKMRESLDPKFKATPDQLANYKQSLPLGSITNITRQLEGTGISTDEFLQLSYSANTHSEELKGSDFLKNYEQAKDFLEIPNDWTEAPSTMKTLTKSYEVRDLVETDPTLSDYANNADNFPKIDKIEYGDIAKQITQNNISFIENFGNEDIQKGLKTFQNDMKEKKYDQYFDEYGNILKKDVKLPDDAKQFYKDYREFLETSTSSINTGLNAAKDKIIRSESLGSRISGVANLFDTTTFKKENFSSDFQLAEKAFSNNEGMLTISGSVNDAPIELAGDPTEKKSLQINTFAEGPKGVFQKSEESLNIKTPTVKQLSHIAESLLKTPGMTEGIMENAKNPQEFQELLQRMLSEKMRDNFIEAPLAKNRIESHIESNLAMHEFIYGFLPGDMGTKIMENGKIEKNGEEEAYAVVATSEATLAELTPPEKRQFRTLQEKTKDILSQEELPDNIPEGPLKNILAEAQADMKNNTLGGIRKLFALMRPDVTDVTTIDEKSSLEDISPIDLNDWSGLISFIEAPHQKIDTNTRPKDLEKSVSPDFLTKLDQLSAVALLDENLNEEKKGEFEFSPSPKVA